MRPRKQFDWAAIQALIDAGNGYKQCNTAFGIAHATWVKAIELGDIRAEMRPNVARRFDWFAIQRMYDAGATVRECLAYFGCSQQAWHKARKRGVLVTKSRLWTTEDALAHSKARITIKRHLLRAGILHNRCDWCGLTSWRDRPISIQIDHVNGIRDDHRVENLRMLCPNCHSQTDTFAAKNKNNRMVDPGSSNGRTASSDVAYCGSSP